MAAEGEDTERVVAAGAPRGSCLVVPIVDRHVGCDCAEDGARVSVAPGGEHGEPAIVDGRLDERTRIEDAEVGFTVPRGRRLARLTRDRGARESSVARRRGARIEVDVLDERRVDHPLADAHVKQEGHSDPVDVVAVVVRWSSADVEVREAAGRAGRRPGARRSRGTDRRRRRASRARRSPRASSDRSRAGCRERSLPRDVPRLWTLAESVADAASRGGGGVDPRGGAPGTSSWRNSTRARMRAPTGRLLEGPA